MQFLDALFTEALEFRRREQDRKVEEVMLHPKEQMTFMRKFVLGYAWQMFMALKRWRF